MSFTDVFGGDTVPPSDSGFAAYSISTNSSFVWPNNYSGTGLLVADVVEVTATAGLTVTLPPANAVSVGEQVLIRNVGANSFDVLDGAGGSLFTVAAGEAKFVYVKDNTTAAGVWGSFGYGAGTSAADASALASYGLKVLSGKLATDHPYIEKSGNYTVMASDRAKLINVTAGSVTVSLPQASVVTAGFFVMVRNTSLGVVTIDPYNTELVNGELTFEMAPGESAVFVNSGAGWYTVGYGRDVEFTFSEFVVNSAAGGIALSASDVAGRMIRIGGTAVGNIVVTLPAIDNIYFVNVENGMGAFNVTFTTGTGTTVVLNANSRTAIYSDGTNVTSAITTALTSTIALDDGSASTPTLSFVLDTDTGLFRRGDNELAIAAGGNEIAYFSALGLVIDPTYGLLVGHDTLSAVSASTYTPIIQNHGATAGASSYLATRWSADINGPRYTLAKSRGASVGTHAIVQDGDTIGVIDFNGSDGVQFLSGANITASVDGTPGVNDMPTRLVFSTTADGASTPTARAYLDSTGAFGVGSVSPTTSITVSKAMTSATTVAGVNSLGQIQSDVTGAVYNFRSSPSTQAAVFTLPTLAHFAALPQAFGAGSVVTNQYGFLVSSSLTGATNNFGFRGDIAAGTNRWNCYMAGTAENYFAGITRFADGAAGTPSITNLVDTNTGLFFTGSDVLGFATAGSERARIDLSGRMVIGHTVSLTAAASIQAQLQVSGAAGSSSSVSMLTFNTSASSAPFLMLGHSKNAAVGSHTLAANGDLAGNISFSCSDGAAFLRTADITSEVDGTPGLNDMPGRLILRTTSDGGTTPTERMRIDSVGLVTLTGTQVINAATSTDALRITQTGAGNALVVEDSANPDSTPFVISSTGFIGQGLTAPATNFHATSGIGAYEMRLQSDNASSGTSIATLNLKATNTRSAGILWSDSADAEIVFIGRPYNGGANSPDLIFRMAGTEAARINSSGKVGIGSTAPLSNLHINGADSEVDILRLTNAVGATQQSVGIGFIPAGPTLANPSAAIRALEFDTSDARANLLFLTRSSNADVAPTEWGRLTDSGRWLLGTTTDDGSSRLQVSGTGAFGGVGTGGLLRVNGFTSGKAEFGTAASTGGSLVRGFADAAVFNDHDGTPTDGTSTVNSRFYRGTTTTGATSLQIYLGDGTANQNHQLFGKGGNSYLVANNGNLLIGTAVDNTVGKAQVFGVLTVSGTSYFAQTSTDLPGLGNTTVGGSIRSVGTVHASSAASNSSFNVNADTTLISMRRSGVQVGSISVTTTATAYNTSSDYRLKISPQPLIDSGAFIDALQPRTWNWAQNGERGTGFIAHELQAVSPSSVVGEKDAVDENGDPIYQAVEYGSAEMIAMMVAELKSLRQRVAALEGA